MNEKDLEQFVDRMHLANVPGLVAAAIESYDPPIVSAEFDSWQSASAFQFQMNEGGGRAAFAPGSETTLRIFK